MFLLLSNETSLKKAFAIITVHRNGKILEKNYSTIINIGNKGDSILYCRLLLRFLFTIDRREVLIEGSINYVGFPMVPTESVVFI